jgi:glycosyltransferase involved in cell wall biosynthesis
MRETTKFTVITPVYNGEKFIRETIESVLTHTESLGIEYLVVDDGSWDGTPSILNDYKNRLKIIRKENSGQAEAINVGINLAVGRYCTVVNADDPIVSDELFKEAAVILDANPSIVVVYPDWCIVDIEGNTIRKIPTKEFSYEELVGNFNCLVGPGGVFRTDIAREVGGWDSSIRYVPDYKFWLEMSTRGSFQRIPNYLAVWRTHGESLSIEGRSLQMAEERINVIKDFLKRYPQETKLSARALSNAYYRAAILTFFDPKVPGRKYIKESFYLDRQNLLSKNKLVLIYILIFSSRLKIIHSATIKSLMMNVARRFNLT